MVKQQELSCYPVLPKVHQKANAGSQWDGEHFILSFLFVCFFAVGRGTSIEVFPELGKCCYQDTFAKCFEACKCQILFQKVL